MWKGIKGIRVLLPLVFISFGNCSDIYDYWYEFCVSLKSAPRYINAMRPGRLYGNLLTWKLKRPWLAYLITSTLPLSMILGSLSLSPTIGVGFGCRRAHLESMRTRGSTLRSVKTRGIEELIENDRLNWTGIGEPLFRPVHSSLGWMQGI